MIYKKKTYRNRTIIVWQGDILPDHMHKQRQIQRFINRVPETNKLLKQLNVKHANACVVHVKDLINDNYNCVK